MSPPRVRATVAAAKAAGTAVGAHPGWPDLIGFGRRNMSCTPDEIYAYTLYQLGALRAFCAAAGVELQHVKAHGAIFGFWRAQRMRSTMPGAATLIPPEEPTVTLPATLSPHFTVNVALEMSTVPPAVTAILAPESE